MINHLYTTLMNCSTNDLLELIDSRFIPQALTIEQEAINFEIFPKKYPLKYKSLTASTLELLVWGSSLADDLSLIDKRSTIRRSEKVQSEILSTNLLLTQFINGVDVSVSTDFPLVASGQYIPNANAGRFSSTWKIQRHSPSTIFITDVESGDQFIKSFTFNPQETVSSLVNIGYGISLSLFGVLNVPESVDVTLYASSPASVNIFEIANRIKSNSNINAIFQNKSVLVDMKYLEHLFFGDDSINVSLPAILVAYAASFNKIL